MTTEKTEVRILKEEMEAKIMEIIKNFKSITGLCVIEIRDTNTVCDKVTTILL